MKVIRLKEVIELTGLSKSSIYRMASDDKFPKPLNLGARSVGWIESEVTQWLAEKLGARNQQKKIA
ncbi:AlpA family transcriptional regulator [Vibrio cholerae]|uniref:helix-turn-helix transcriptional regulator n=1 Tax=Vibrio cholerae TaxID=666 RepID=UPI0011DB8C1F|nr:AlpA family transcriptional regulator [Vibrio cholerae]MBY3671924.1 AlpA family transcriptional regulator [Vibrio cholerae]TYA61609.1 AlpA family transcriptional regulator [Vibrio cholerae]GHW54530.1 helix-turn-helix domain protein [Vibrio cholerae]